MSENFIFTYLGITIFARADAVYRWDLIAASVLVLLISRACNVFPLSALANMVNRHDKIGMNHQIMMWWSGMSARPPSFIMTAAAALIDRPSRYSN
jgi:NhaP-type Na+/H+ or K+/H+ antiporter